MSTEVVTSSSAWIRAVVHMFSSLGVEPEWLFNEAGLDIERLKHSHNRFTAAEIARLWALAVARTGQPSLALDRNLARRYINFDMAAQSMWASQNLLGGVESLSRYLILIGDSASFEVKLERGDAWLTLMHGADTHTPRQRMEFGLLTLFLLCQKVTRHTFRPLAVDFFYPEPEDLHPYRMAFQCPLRFGQPANRLRIARDDLALPIISKTDSLFAVHERVIEDRLARLGKKARTSYRASEEIIRRLHLGQPTRADVARSLGLTEPELEQKLRTEGTTYSDLLDGVRRELSELYLAQNTYALGRTTSLLGWDTPAEFAAACKRWFGLAPAQYRQRLESNQYSA